MPEEFSKAKNGNRTRLEATQFFTSGSVNFFVAASAAKPCFAMSGSLKVVRFRREDLKHSVRTSIFGLGSILMQKYL